MGKEAHFLRRAYRYIRHDVPEIIFPSSLPNPPGYIEPPRKTLRQHVAKINSAIQRYIDSWDSEKLQAELKRQRGEVNDSLTKEEERMAAEEISMLAKEFKDVARGGAHTMWPHLQHIYKTRVRAYREAVNQFIEGYKEGLAEKSEGTGGGGGGGRKQ
ncbi:hypothetical protein NADE_006360 [Nannochloris sp. 'desiccata']|nr:hypothetical protein KSW81_008247 [Chlorella desiccata (nom. nud.)]KAH7619523.1 hypothetical protein NADE_006360 [Chlorella desiccata (nom. nud.)]